MRLGAVCFSGRIGSGKTSVSRLVAQELNAAWTGFGDFVRAVATERGLDTNSREVLQRLGESLIEMRGTAWLCHEVISRGRWSRDRLLIIDGVRHVSVLDELIIQLVDLKVILIHLALDGKAAEDRGLTAAVRASIERHSTERDVRQALPARADLILAVGQPLEVVVGSALAFIKQEFNS